MTSGYVEAAGKHFVIAHAPGRDELLAPYALEALDRAWAALGDDFGDRPAGLTRVEIYPEVADLAKVSTLTLKEIETSGTIAICKFNRLMIVSPRALVHGYPWLDTLAHEFTHYVISRASHDQVPIWLQEGLAKFEEARWRSAKQGHASTPTMEHLLAAGLARKHLITFAEMHPSMAKLPSQEDTALAFAEEVYMVVEYLHQTVGLGRGCGKLSHLHARRQERTEAVGPGGGQVVRASFRATGAAGCASRSSSSGRGWCRPRSSSRRARTSPTRTTR